MSGERFTLDTNSPVYAFDSSAGAKRVIARDIIRKAADHNLGRGRIVNPFDGEVMAKPVADLLN